MKKVVIIFVVFAILFSGFTFSALASSSNEVEIQSQSISIAEPDDNMVNSMYLYVDEYYYDINSAINVIIYTSFSSEISNITFNFDGFELVDNYEMVGSEIHFSVLYRSPAENPYFECNVTLDSGITLTSKLFGIIREGMIFVDPHAHFLAENAYEYYLKNNSDEVENDIIQETVADDFVNISDEESLEQNSLINPDVTIEGKISWTDFGGQIHPLRFCKIQINRAIYVGDTHTSDIYLLETYTDENGEFSFQYVNDLIDGISNLSIKVYAQGYDIDVRDSYNNLYSNTIYRTSWAGLGNVEDGYHDLGEYTYNINTAADEEYNFFWRTLHISQAAVCASTYYEAMKNCDVEDVDIIYPHTESNDGCFYRGSEKTIYIIGDTSTITLQSYASWDIITHEYGHHVANCEGIDDSPGDWHGMNVDMAEHYRSHFDGTATGCDDKCALLNNSSEYKFEKSECKEKGVAIAWAEGFATFFGELSQQYFYDEYISQYTNEQKPLNFANSIYEAYNLVNPLSMEVIGSDLMYRRESCEFSVLCILYDIFDNDNSEDFDLFSMDHQSMWDCVINSNAKTLYEFIEYFKSTRTNTGDIAHLGRLLNEYHYTPVEITMSSIGTECPSITFVASYYPLSPHFSTRKFKVNFYDYAYNLIGSTPIQDMTLNSTNRCTTTISEELWHDIINYETTFYMSISAYEYDVDTDNPNGHEYVTGYESKLSLYTTNNIYTILDYAMEPTDDLADTGYNWYKFTAPLTEEYIFETTGSADTYGEIFSELVIGQSISNRILYDDDNGDSLNFKLVYSMKKGDTIYIRVRRYDWLKFGEYTLTISSTKHTHSYTDYYEVDGATYHKAYCFCGAYRQEYHEFLSIPTGNRCKYCSYFVRNIPVIKQDIVDIITNETQNKVYLKEDEYA